ncbi:sensor histidine kinase [Microvirga makkahensis]|uniref:Blue-light-activated histidine kinase n=1 Tax=Microvirga makkahensis TaxID=1128670 RepID=A0A7X3MSH7_9HYPH|nr:PAS domain S-box protein [Microvirga makkahensis]MXQ12404.1 PAS domain S-box protein [Microvirga makkahensis]
MHDRSPESSDQNALLQRLETLEKENQALRAQLKALRTESDATAASVAQQVREDVTSVASEHAQRLASASSRIRELKQTRNSLRASEGWLRAILESATDYAIITLDLDGLITSWNSGARNILGWDEGEVLGRDGAFIFTSEDREAGVPQMEMQKALAEGRALDERWHLRQDGTRFWASGMLMPFMDGALLGYLKILRDRTEERQSGQHLRESEERLELMANAVPQIIWITDAEGRHEFFNRQWSLYTGAAPTATDASQVAADFVHPDDQAATMAAFEEAKRTGGIFEVEHRIRSKDGEYRWFLVRAEPYRDPQTGSIARWFGVSIDIHDRRLAQDHQRLLINELNHRVKNTLATVQSVATQTLRNAPSAEAAREAIEARLIALSRAHDVLTRENWEGAHLREIVQQAIEPYRWYGDGRFDIRGADIRLSPRVALAVSMALQELVTNAVKYGALSNDTGRVLIAWRLTGQADKPSLELCWEEMGGPPVQEPSRRGFGTKLIERSLAQELDGKVEIRFEPGGVVCTIVTPLAVGTEFDW